MPLVICENCSKEFNKRISQIKKTKRNFCSRSCSATFNNKKYPKRHNEGFCHFCGTEVPKRRSYCDDCLPNNIDWDTITYGEVKARYKYQRNSRIRELARDVYTKSGLPERCVICGYDKHYHVSHKKAINTFSLGTFVSVINDLTNLVALCPNHHWEFDNGLLVLP